MPVMNVMIKPASGMCNMRCTYCFYADEMRSRQQGLLGIMSQETQENVIRETLRFARKECTIAYQGGEPTLAGLEYFRRGVALANQYNVNGVRLHYALQTNGYALDEEWCRFFHDNHFLIGLSIDGIKATHDACRRDAGGQDTYLRVLEAAGLLAAHGVDFNVLTVVNAKTAPRIRRIYSQYAKQGFRYQQYIACLEPMGEKWGGQDYSLTPEAYGRFLIELFELWDIDFMQGRQPYIRQFENWIGILMGQRPESCEQCGVCNIQNIVEADGSVYPCDFYALDEYNIGNLNRASFEEIYQNREKLGFLESSENHCRSCRECRYFSLCRGGCRRHREGMEAPEGGFGNYFCRSYRMLFDRYYDRMCEIAGLCMSGRGN